MSLSNEVLLTIFQHLQDAKSVDQLGATCTRLAAIARDATIWEPLVRSHFPQASVADPCYFGSDPDLRIHTSDQWIQIRILPFSSCDLQDVKKFNFSKLFCLLLFEGTFYIIFQSSKVIKKCAAHGTFRYFELCSICLREGLGRSKPATNP
jgi:hypothetical protein